MDLRTGLIALTSALQLGCEAPLPKDPGFEVDVRPILQARCVRCHGAGGMLNGDPQIPGYGAPSRSFLGEYDDVLTGCPGPMDPPQALSPSCHEGAASVAELITFYLHQPDASRMPPLPSPALTDWEIAVVDAWASKTPPER